MRILRSALAIGLFATIVFASSCKKEIAVEPIGSVNCDTIPHTFANDILPIFQNNCTNVGCHSGASANGGHLWEDYSQIGDPSKHNLILDAINHRPGATPMPFNMPQIPDSLIQRIECWIQNGALNN